MTFGRGRRRRRILLVVDRCGLGDAYRVRDLVDAAWRSSAGVSVTLVAGEAAAPALQGLLGVERVVVSRLYAPSARPGALRRVAMALELVRLRLRLGRRHDDAIVFQWGSPALAFLAWLSARRRHGYRNGPRWLLTSRLGTYGVGGERAQNEALLRLAGLEPPPPGVRPRDWNDAEWHAARALLAEHGVAPQRLVVLHAGSDWACQQWAPARWAEVAGHLWRTQGVHIVLTGDARDRDHLAHIAGLSDAPCVPVAGETTLGMMAALLSMARLCVSVDSAIYELAQRAGVPAVVLAGPTTAEVLPVATAPVVVVNETPAATGARIGRCQQTRRANRCQDWACPLAGLPRIGVPAVLAAIAATGALPAVASLA